MPTILFIDPAGDVTPVDCKPGDSLMQAAVEHGLPGILGECGGNCACATCHVYVEDPALPPANAAEAAMLEGVLERRANSRLACQIAATEALDGLRVHMPTRQV